MAARLAQHGRLVAFHGSPLQNWWSIIGSGVRVLSGTAHQLHGAAHGRGVYLSTQFSVSAGYSATAQGCQENWTTCAAAQITRPGSITAV
jgi:hypothetical protein